MRALVLVPLLALWAHADDNTVLKSAVGHFKSRDPIQREAASRKATEEARKLLAPLVEAMEDPDPEVRRRAREAILSLVPRKHQEPKDTAIHGRTEVFVQPWPNYQRRFFVQKWIPGQQKAAEKARERARLAAAAVEAARIRGTLGRLQAQNFEEKEKELWVKLGLRGDLVVSVINQRGRRMELSFRVVSVSEESPTARMGVRAGDIIREINGRTLSGRHPFYALLGDKPELTKLKVIRGAEIVELVKP